MRTQSTSALVLRNDNLRYTKKVIKLLNAINLFIVKRWVFIVLVLIFSVVATFGILHINKLNRENVELNSKFESATADLARLQSEDPYKINKTLQEEITNINKTFIAAEDKYQEITDLDVLKGKTDEIKKLFAQILTYLADRNYSSASAKLLILGEDIEKEKTRVSLLSNSSSKTAIDTSNLTQSNIPPGSGYSRQSVSALGSTYAVDIIAADMASTKIIVDTASESDCRDNCPVLSLGDYVSRNGAFAGINGSYFCPAEYPTCAGKKNSFDTLLMNKNKIYFNSDNNVYSTIPAVIFQSGSMRFVGQSLQWGRDTGVDGVLANQPLLVSGGSIAFTGNGDPKQGSKGSRSFVGNKGSIAYIGVVRNVTVAEMAEVLKALGLENALNLDSGGSTALWYGGYKAGPGRNIPNAILFIKK